MDSKDVVRIVAGVGIYAVSLALVLKGQYQEALYLALPTTGFFIGEVNGKRQTN